MTETNPAGNEAYPDTVGNTIVTVEILPNPPARESRNWGITAILAMQAKSNRSSLTPSWEAVDVTDSDRGVRYVSMNNCAFAGFASPGYLGTANLNGCTAIAACYRDEQDTAHAFLEHYDAENMREVDENGILKMSGLLAGFAGQQPVRVAIAYSKDHNPLYANKYPCNPEDSPIDAIIEGCRELPNGSTVLLIPYETSNNFNDPKVGHMLYVGHSGAGLIDFGWNGHEVEVGAPELFDDNRRAAARALMASVLEDTIDDYDSLME